jgi:hypothetical protein
MSTKVIDLLAAVRPGERSTPYGSVWEVFSAHGLEAAVVVKHHDEIDPSWFSQDVVDLIVVLSGHLRVEFDGARPPLTLHPGHLLVLEPGSRCRAYSWPRSSRVPAVFLAVYPRPREPLPAHAVAEACAAASAGPTSM